MIGDLVCEGWRLCDKNNGLRQEGSCVDPHSIGRARVSGSKEQSRVTTGTKEDPWNHIIPICVEGLLQGSELDCDITQEVLKHYAARDSAGDKARHGRRHEDLDGRQLNVGDGIGQCALWHVGHILDLHASRRGCGRGMCHISLCRRGGHKNCLVALPVNKLAACVQKSGQRMGCNTGAACK